ncbi:MAG: hypothetical protein ACRCZF_12345 [Gemmataceae bacterium]
MTRIHKALLVVTLTVVGIWGCARPAPSALSNEKLKQLEARVAKLETDLQQSATERDALEKKLATSVAAEAQLRTKLAHAEETLKTQIVKIATLEKERDGALAKFKVKTVERDQVQAQYDAFRKNLRDILGQSESPTGLVQHQQ